MKLFLRKEVINDSDHEWRLQNNFENRIVSVVVGTASFHRIIAIDIETEEKHHCKGKPMPLCTELEECAKLKIVTRSF